MRYQFLVLAILGAVASVVRAEAGKYSAYLMAYFGPEEKLFYAVSDDARHWQTLNAGKPVFDAKARLCDPFTSPLQVWETTNFVDFTKIEVTPPDGAKHCSMIPITRAELDALRRQYPTP